MVRNTHPFQRDWSFHRHLGDHRLFPVALDAVMGKSHMGRINLQQQRDITKKGNVNTKGHIYSAVAFKASWEIPEATRPTSTIMVGTSIQQSSSLLKVVAAENAISAGHEGIASDHLSLLQYICCATPDANSCSHLYIFLPSNLHSRPSLSGAYQHTVTTVRMRKQRCETWHDAASTGMTNATWRVIT